MKSVVERIRATIAEYRMFDKGEGVIIGVSGGPDSVALLYILFFLRDEYGLNLYIAHLNHRLRQEEAEGDALFVKDLAERLKLPFFIEAVDLRTKLKNSHLSLEALARKERYEFFLRIAKKTGATKVALGHQANDVVETILMHLIRGSGLSGLVGIPPLRKLSEEVVLVRPLIRITSDEIKDYLGERGIPWRYDSSNLSPIYLRNRIRHELIPKFLEYNPKFQQTLIRNLSLWTEDNQYLQSLTREILSSLIQERSPSEIVFDLNRFDGHKSLRFRLIREGLSLIKPDLAGITYGHIEAIANLIEYGPSQGQVNLPHRIKAVREYDRLRLYIEKNEERKKKSFEYSIGIPGRVQISQLDLALETEILPANGFILSNLKEISSDSTVYLDYDRIELPLLIRTRLEGDRFWPLGAGGRKKIKDFFIDLKIPRALRDQIPLLLDKKGVIWVIGYRIDERVKITSETKRILRIRVENYE